MKKGEKSPSTQVIIAALNEEEGIGPTLLEIGRFLDEPRIVVVDGKSTDRTVEIAKDICEIIFQDGTGKGNAISCAINNVDIDSDYVVLTDADYTYPAEHIPSMIRILENNPRIGMVCGNRLCSSRRLRAMHDVFFLGNRFLAFVHNTLNGVNMRDPLTGLRVVRGEIFKNWAPKSQGFDIEVELNHYVEKRGYQIAEMPIFYRKRLGKKKLGLKHGITILRRMVLENIHDGL